MQTSQNKNFTNAFNSFAQSKDFPVQLDSIPNNDTKLTGGSLSGYGSITESAHKGKIVLYVSHPYKDKSIPKIVCFTHKHGGVSATFDGKQYVGSAIDATTLCDSIYSDLADIEPPAAGEKVAPASNKTFNLVKAHLNDPRNKAKKQLPNRYLADKGLSNSDWDFHFQGVPLYLKSDDESKAYSDGLAYRNGLYVPFFDVNHELVAYQLIIDRYAAPKTKQRGKTIVETGGFTASEYTPTAKYVDSPKRFYVEFEGGSRGAYCLIGNEYDPQQGEIIAVEGLATGLAIIKINPAACVVICGSSINIKPVVNTLLEQAVTSWFEGLKRIIICADNDIVKFREQLASGNKNALNTGIYAAVQAHVAHKDNALGVDIAVCSIPDNVALEHGLSDFDDYRQYLATVGKTLSSWQSYQLDVTQLLKNPLEFCSESKAKALCGNDIVRAAITRALHIKNLSAHFDKMGTFTRTQLVNERYLSNGLDMVKLMNTKGLTFIKSPMGTGKTTFIKELFSSLNQYGKTGLYTCPSRALTRQMRDSLSRVDGLNVIHYKDVGGRDLTLVSNFIGITTINSLWRFGGVKPHTVVIDESEQLLSVITSKIIEYPQSTMDYLRDFCVNAQHVILCDAQMSKLTVDTMQRIKPNADSLLIHNTFKMAKDKHVTMLSTKGEFWAKFDELLKAGKKVYICTGSKHEARALSEFMKHRYPTIACLTLVANDDDDVKLLATLENINNEVLKYQVVIASPVVSSGVSIDKTHFDVVMGCFLPHMLLTPSLVTAVQQLGRVREVKELYVFFQDRRNAKLEIDPAKLLKYKKHELRFVANPKQVYDAVTGVVTVVPTYPDHVLLHYENEAKQNLLDRQPKESFLFLLNEEGYQVTFEPESTALNDHGRALRKEARAVSKAKYHNAIAAASYASIEQVAALKAKNLKSKEEYAAIVKNTACEFMGLESTDFTAAHSELWASGLESKINRLELLKTHDDLVSTRDKEAHESAVEKSTEYTTFELLKSRKWIDGVVLSAFFDSDGNHYENVCNTSPSVIKAKNTLLRDESLLKLKRINVGQLRLAPIKIFSEQLKGMGFDCKKKQVRIGKDAFDKDIFARYYTASINPDIDCVLQHRESLCIASHLDNPVSMFLGCDKPNDETCNRGKWANISLGENDKFPCYKTLESVGNSDNYPDYHLGIDPNIEAPPAYLCEDVPIAYY